MLGRSGLGQSGLVLGSVLLCLVLFELALRAWPAPGNLLRWTNLVEDARSAHRVNEAMRFKPDPQLGHVPKEGLRGNGGPAPATDKRPILAVGDSFTYGEEVKESETWPAHLERMLRRPVLNGGVSGYGFDQSVLRAELLANQYRPAAIVVSFIADDIRRTEMSRLWGANKPWLDFEGDKLVLRGVPVPPPGEARATLTFWQRTLGYFYIVDRVLRLANALDGWFGDHVRVHPRGAGAAISCKIAEQLGVLQADMNVPVFLLAQYDPQMWKSDPAGNEQRRLSEALLKCAKAHKIAVIDSFDGLRGQPGQIGRLYGTWHMNSAGNELTAALVADALKKRGID